MAALEVALEVWGLRSPLQIVFKIGVSSSLSEMKRESFLGA